MEAVNVVLRLADEDQIIAIYEELIRNGNYENAYQLRVQFIVQKLKGSDHFFWMGAMQYFILKEIEDIENSSLMLDVNEHNSNKYLTQIAPLLLAKLMSENLVEYDDVRIFQVTVKEKRYVYKTRFEDKSSRASTNMIVGLEAEAGDIIREILRRAKKTYQVLRDMPVKLTGEADTASIEKNLDKLVGLAQSRHDYATLRFQPLREELLVLILYHWRRKDLIKTRYFIDRSLEVTGEHQMLVRLFNFLKRELSV